MTTTETIYDSELEEGVVALVRDLKETIKDFQDGHYHHEDPTYINGRIEGFETIVDVLADLLTHHMRKDVN